MKRYLLSTGEKGYSVGGWCEINGSFHTIDKAKKWFLENIMNNNSKSADVWGDIVDWKEEKVKEVFEDNQWVIYENSRIKKFMDKEKEGLNKA